MISKYDCTAALAIKDGETMNLVLSSPAFRHGGLIPKSHTCDGDDTSPPLCWSGIPDGTRSLALLVEDPDAPDPKAPTTIWVHWVLYNIPVDSTGLPADLDAEGLPGDARAGKNDWQRIGYGGPCPPVGRHRYFFKLYALNIELPDLGHPGKHELEQAMNNHILAEATLIGTYSRGR